MGIRDILVTGVKARLPTDKEVSQESPKRDTAPPPDYKPWVKTCCEAVGIPVPEAEHKFLSGRKFRLDFYWNNPGKCPSGIGLEIDGGAWTQGRHTRGAGFLSDMEKSNLAIMEGIAVLRCTPEQLEKGSIFLLVKKLLNPD